MNKYYALATSGRTADIYIFGDITSWEWLESDVSSYTLSKELQGLDVDTINVHINSYGGEVAEGLAIYNMLKNHKAKVNTICEGFACSIAAVIFMAGDERIMNNASLLMVHNAWTCTAGNANELRKQADDLEVINQSTMEAFKAHVNISDDELKTLLDNESWLSPQEALEKGFATSIKASENNESPSQSVKNKVVEMLVNHAEPQKQVIQVSPPVIDDKELLQRLKAYFEEQALLQPQQQTPVEPQPQKTLNFIAKAKGE